MSKFETTIADSAGCNITLYHDPDDPSTWIVRKYTRQLFWKRCELSRWFNTREQAQAYAVSLQEQCRKKERLAS